MDDSSSPQNDQIPSDEIIDTFKYIPLDLVRFDLVFAPKAGRDLRGRAPSVAALYHLVRGLIQLE